MNLSSSSASVRRAPPVGPTTRRRCSTNRFMGPGGMTNGSRGELCLSVYYSLGGYGGARRLFLERKRLAARLCERESHPKLDFRARTSERLNGWRYPFALSGSAGSSPTLTQTWTWGVPRKYQTKAGPSNRQLSHSPSLPRSPSL